MKPCVSIIGSFAIYLTLGSVGLAQEVLKPIAPKFKPDPMVYEGTISGEISMKDLTAGQKVNGRCKGRTILTPMYVLPVESSFGYLSLKIRGEGITLLVKGPDGIFCRHDKEPELSGAWEPGKYQIWIGTKRNNSPANFRLSISETQQ